MNRASASSRGYRAGSPLASVGRAERATCGDETELWTLPASDEIACGRLLVLSQRNVGGFVDGGIDEGGAWLVRKLRGKSLASVLRKTKGPFPYRDALAIALGVARALAACEKASLFPGALAPDAIRVEGTQVWLPCERLVGALVGAEAAPLASESTVAPMWTPPEQADGAVWDAAANRYALGLLLYRLLAGVHPFGGAGLRHAMGEAARSEAAPFEEAIAASLPAGLQSLVLRLLDPQKSKRPAKASAVAVDLERFLEAGDAAATHRPAQKRSGGTWESEPAETDEGPVATPRPLGGRSKKPVFQRLVAFWPLLLGALVAAATLMFLSPEPPPHPRVVVPAAASLTSATTAATDCAACHARQAAEWRRSIMAHSVKSPLFNALEMLIEEQVGRDQDCPNGAGILRVADPRTACRDRASGQQVTGSGGEHWCVNCHSPADNLGTSMPAWDGRRGGDAKSRLPVRDLLGDRAMEGISCGFCHQVHGPVGPRGSGGSRAYQGNATWTSFVTGSVFEARPEDRRRLFGIGNSGYDLRPEELLLRRPGGASELGGTDPVVHGRPSREASAYLRSSEFCGACHDVRLFGTDTLGASKGEHFKRLRNAYSEWAAWAADETRQGRSAATCQDCHMSTYPGVCVPEPGAVGAGGCPDGTRKQARAPGEWAKARVADNSNEAKDASVHYFSGVDLPLAEDFPEALFDELAIDDSGLPLSAKRRRDLLLQGTFRFAVEDARLAGNTLQIPITIENIGAGHRVPAGFSQEREIWVHLVVRDSAGRVVYEVGRVDRGDEDLHDKVMTRVNVRGDLDALGRPEGLFGADVRDGPDVPLWEPPPERGGSSFRGRGLINFQNGFLRCVRCIGQIGRDGRCEALPGQNRNRADRFEDGDYDLDTGECRSNLRGLDALFETYFPVGALDARRGLLKGPDAIIDTRSLPPNVPHRYLYELPVGRRAGPFTAEARLLFRAFPPFLVRAFADYEREQERRGLRPSGALVTEAMLKRLEVVEIEKRSIEIR